MDATLGQPRSGDRTQSPHQLDRQVTEKIQTAACFESARDLPWCGFLRSGGFRPAFAADRNLCLARTGSGVARSAARFMNMPIQPELHVGSTTGSSIAK